MKKFRCPCCGKEDASVFMKMLHFSLYLWQDTFFYKFCHHARHDFEDIYYYDIECQECYRTYMSLPYYPQLHRFIRIMDIFLADIGCFIGFIAMIVIWNLLGAAVCLLLFLILKAAKLFYSCRFQYFAPYNHEASKIYYFDRDVVLKLEPEANWKPRHMDILMLRFKKPCEYPKFKEVYQESLVPICLYIEEPGRIEASFLKKEPILKKMLHQGAVFELIDQETVATGVIETFLSEEYLDLCEEIIH